MSGKEFGPGEAPPPYGSGDPTGDQPPANPGHPAPVYPGQPAPVSGQPVYAPQYAAYLNTGYTTTTVVPANMQIQSPPPDHFCLAVFVTLCCFWPTGILAIMKASDARTSASRGDMMTAHSQARSAKQMINVTIGVGIASIVVVGIIIGVYVGLILNAGIYD